MSYNSLLINHCVVVDAEYDKWGEPTGVIVLTPEKCRIEYMNRLVRTTGGQEILCYAKVFLKANSVATNQSYLRFDGKDHPIAELSTPQNQIHIHHKEALVR
jgi:hypothetical protein